MKLLVLVVFSVELFSASCHERPDGRELNNDGPNLSDGSSLPDDLSNGGDQYYGSDLPKGPKDEASTVEPEPFSGGPLDGISSTDEPEHFSGGPLDGVSSTDEPEHFSGGPLDGVSSTDVDMGFPSKEFLPELVRAGFQNHDSFDIDHQLKEDGSIQNERKLRGGSKCKPDIMCSLLGGSCVSNSTYCSGRELPSVCGGPKCKCCITVNLEVKMHDVETELRSMIVNFTIANFNLNTKLDSIMNYIISANSSQATVNSNMDLKIDSIMSTNSNLDLKIDSLMSTNSNLTIANSNMDLKIDSIMSTNSNLTIANSHHNTKLESMMNFMISTNTSQAIVNSNQDEKLDSIMEHQGCPEGTFLFTPSNQCFRVLNDTKRTYDEAKTACNALGLQLAQPYDALSLRSYLVQNTVTVNEWCWLGARGDGSNMKWERTGQAIRGTNNPLWYTGRPGNYVSTANCLALMAHDHHLKLQPNQPYFNYGCHNKFWTLCEHVME